MDNPSTPPSPGSATKGQKRKLEADAAVPAPDLRRSPRKRKQFAELPLQTLALFGYPTSSSARAALALDGTRRSTAAGASPRKVRPRRAVTFSAGAANKKICHEVRRCGRVLRQVRTSPNVFEIDDFLTAGECEHLMAIVEKQKRKFKASFTECEDNVKVVSTERTSTYIHLKKGANSIVRTIERRAAEIVGATSQNVEPLQLVSYTNGQKFNLHHDAATLCDDGSCTEVVPPRRVATLFVYLNTMEDESVGHTEFPRLSLSVRPIASKAVLWSNLDIHSGKPEEADPMTAHKACPVPAGCRKVGLNVWITDINLQHLAL